MLELCAGTAYGYGLYSETLKRNLGLSQQQVNEIASIGNLGLNVGAIGGSFYDHYGVTHHIHHGLLP